MLKTIQQAIALRFQAITRVRAGNDEPRDHDAVEVHWLPIEDDKKQSANDSRGNDSTTADLAASVSDDCSSYSRRQVAGWRFAVLNFAIWACIVLIINLSVTVWALRAHREDVLNAGDCGHIKMLNTALHVFINILSTILLSGSNYCMQCLSAPTRADIDRAHAFGKWLDIGVPSLRNLRHISRRRLVLWCLLGTSSVPLHLLYNSAIYSSISTNSYQGFLVNENFLDSGTTNFHTGTSSSSLALTYLYDNAQNDFLERLSPTQCITEYGTLVQSFRRNLLAVTAKKNVKSNRIPLSPDFRNDNLLYRWHSQAKSGLGTSPDDMVAWICQGLSPQPNSLCINRLNEARRSDRKWTVGEKCNEDGVKSPGVWWEPCDQRQWEVDYCLSEKADLRCQIHFSPSIAFIVTALNACKAVLMVLVFFLVRKDPLITMGDAVASFLQENDMYSSHMALISKYNMKKGYHPAVTTWNDQRWRWKDATSRPRRAVTIVIQSSVLGTVTALTWWGVDMINARFLTDTSQVFRIGFGAVDPRTLVHNIQLPGDIISLAVIANSPQIVLSVLYFAYNSLFTAMLMGYEWTSYAYKRKGLRVSRSPVGHQRTTYFLSLPYRFALPLVILSGTLHWLVSQGIFVVAFDLYDEYGAPIGASDVSVPTMTIGYSPVAMFAFIVLGLLMVAALLGFGMILYKPGMPLAGSCSLAISAACHPGQDEAENIAVWKQKLQWGVTGTTINGVGHCAFSSKEVGPLVKGRIYA